MNTHEIQTLSDIPDAENFSQYTVDKAPIPNAEESHKKALKFIKRNNSFFKPQASLSSEYSAYSTVSKSSAHREASNKISLEEIGTLIKLRSSNGYYHVEYELYSFVKQNAFRTDFLFNLTVDELININHVCSYLVKLGYQVTPVLDNGKILMKISWKKQL